MHRLRTRPERIEMGRLGLNIVFNLAEIKIGTVENTFVCSHQYPVHIQERPKEKKREGENNRGRLDGIEKAYPSSSRLP